LGGNNGVANSINSQGQAVGMAENQTLDPSCPAPQVLQFKPVLWQNGKVQQLPTFPGDLNGIAFGINDSGQIAGTSGICAAFDPHSNTNIFPNHALLWQDGTMTDLGNLGGTTGNIALAINNQGQVVGDSDLPGDQVFHAFLWTKEKGMHDLGVLPGDVYSSAAGLNNADQVVGLSLDADFNLRAVLWEKGVAIDLNTLIPAKSGLFLQLAESINSRGEIIGFGQTSAGDTHAFMASPIVRTTASAGPKNATVLARETTLDGMASVSSDGKPLTYLWSIPQGQGNPSAAILQATTATPIIQFGQTRGVYTFQLTVTDSTGTSASDLTTVNFQGN
jgi:probable HAF family extracellular repeat protein